MTDSLHDTKRLAESGSYEVVELAESAQLRYRQLQVTAIVSALIHASAVFLAIFSVREGNLYDFSVTRLLQFVSANRVLWQVSCLSVSMSTISFLVLFLAFRNVLRVRQTLWITAASFVVAIGLANDLQSQGNMLVYFSDLSHQVTHGSYPRQQLNLEAWRTLNESVTQSLLIANALYSLSGLVLSGAIITGYGLPKWLGWTSIPIWLVGLAASALVFSGGFSWAVILMFAMIIAYILWNIATAVAIDPYTHVHRVHEPAEGTPDN